MSETKSSQQRIGALDARGWTTESGARLKAAVRAAKWQQERLAEAAGVARSTLAAIFKGDHTPREATLAAICEVIGLDPEDLVTGHLPSASFAPPDLSRPLAGDVRLGDDEYSLVKHFTVNVSAGPGLIPISEASVGGMAFARSWLIRRGIAADMAGLVTVKGDSMAPTIHDGATVLVHLAECEVKQSGIYVFSRGGEACIKRIVPAAREEDGRASTLVIMSDNTEYQPEVVTGPALNEVRIIGRVRMVLADV